MAGLDKGWHFDYEVTNHAILKPLCLQVENHFALPAQRLHRYFAGSDDAYLSQQFGPHYRGFHVPRAGRHCLPKHLDDSFFHPLEPFKDVSYDEMIAFDNLIYIRHSTCSDVTGCVTTYAHELQHFVQHCNTPKILAANRVLYERLKDFEPTATEIDLPHEYEATIVSKQVCGVDAVRRFAEQQVRFMEENGAVEQKIRWVFFRDVPSSTEYNLVEETIRLVEKYKGKIDFEMDVNQPKWWLGAVEEDE